MAQELLRAAQIVQIIIRDFQVVPPGATVKSAVYPEA
jgi:hypothetical protein